MGRHPKGKYTSKNPLTEGQNSIRKSSMRDGSSGVSQRMGDDPIYHGFVNPISQPLYIDTPLSTGKDLEEVERQAALAAEKKAAHDAEISLSVSSGKDDVDTVAAEDVSSGDTSVDKSASSSEKNAVPTESKGGAEEHEARDLVGSGVKESASHDGSDDGSDTRSDTVQKIETPDKAENTPNDDSLVNKVSNGSLQHSRDKDKASDALHGAGESTSNESDSVAGKHDLSDDEGLSKKEKKAKKKKSKGKHGKHSAPSGAAVLESSPSDGNTEAGYVPVFEIKDKKKRNWKKIGKRIGITFGSVAAVLVLGYFAGVLLFTSHFLPNTHISDMDISFQTPEEVKSSLDKRVGDYSFSVKGQGMNVKVTSAQAGFNLDSNQTTRQIMEGQDAWRWPLDLFEYKDETKALTEAMSATELSNVITAAVDEVNAKATPPVDAYVSFNTDKSIFEIVPEVEGTLLDGAEVLEAVVVSAMNLDHSIILTKEVRVEPAVYSDDERLGGALNASNGLLKTNLQVNMDGNTVAEVNPSVVGPWVTVSPEFEVSLDNELMSGWINDLASKCNTVGTARTYTRHDGKVVNVSGGSYGWKIDSDTLVAELSEAISAATTGVIDIPVLQSGKGFTSVGGQDWGNRYIDIDLGEQHARLYDDSGAVIWESDIVSGAYQKTDTPQGVYVINNRQKNVTLVGQMVDGKPEYESKVAFWMPFKGNSVGLHDATWQSAFGGSRFKQGFGSHGCVNLPYSSAQSLYDVVQVGDVVVVHY